jgi:glycosyltransferase involved in cell wall biosynthesis
VIEKTIAKNKIYFSLIHAHFLMPTTPTAISLKKKYGKKVVLTLHGGDIYNWPYQKTKNLSIAKNILEEVDAITVVSEYVNENIKKLSPLCLKKSVSINNFIDLNKFKIIDKASCRKNLSLPQDKKILLNVSNLVKSKGHDDLIKSIASLKDKTRDFQLYIIGEGAEECNIKKKIKELKLDNFITIVGSVSNENLLQWYCASDLFVFPSYQESFGIVQIEAMACGTPVIAYENEGSKEVLSGYKNNLVKIGDIENLSKKIDESLKDMNSNSEERRQKRRQYVEDNFSAKETKKKLIHLYEELINQQD